MSHPPISRDPLIRQLLLAALCLSGCASRSRGHRLPPPEPPYHSDGEIHRCEAVPSELQTAKSSGSSDHRTVRVRVVAAQVEGDNLLVHAGYADGCGKHELALCYTEAPVREGRIILRLTDRTDNRCEMSGIRWFVFDLKSLKQDYQRGTASGRLLLEVSPEASVLYNY